MALQAPTYFDGHGPRGSMHLMNRGELADIIRNGESSGVEFKLDSVDQRDLAKELVASPTWRAGSSCSEWQTMAPRSAPLDPI